MLLNEPQKWVETKLLGHVSQYMCQARVSQISARYKVYVRPRGITRNFLAVFRQFWHSIFPRMIWLRLQGFSEFDRYSLHSGIFFQSPQGHLGDMGSRMILSSLSWTNLLTSLWRLAPLVVLVRKSARFLPVPIYIRRVSPIATNSWIAW